MKWIQSNGGPLVLVPESRLGIWHGIDAESGNDTTDYERACAVTEEVAVVTKDGIDVLVLGDEPFMTTWIPRGTGGLLLRWVYANGEQSILDFLGDDLSLEVSMVPGGTFRMLGPCLLFDAAEPGTSIRGSSLRVDLPPGHYEIATALVNPSESVRLLIHQLNPKS